MLSMKREAARDSLFKGTFRLSLLFQYVLFHGGPGVKVLDVVMLLAGESEYHSIQYCDMCTSKGYNTGDQARSYTSQALLLLAVLCGYLFDSSFSNAQLVAPCSLLATLVMLRLVPPTVTFSRCLLYPVASVLSSNYTSMIPYTCVVQCPYQLLVQLLVHGTFGYCILQSIISITDCYCIVHTGTQPIVAFVASACYCLC